MTPQDLRNSILQLAMQGKLVEQRAEEGTAEDIIDILRREVKKDFQIIEDSPFDIPTSWMWISHNDIFEIVGGSQPPKSEFVEELQDGYVRLYQIRDYGDKPVPVYVPLKSVSKFTENGDILLARYGGSLGKVFWAREGAYNVAMAKSVKLYQTEVINDDYRFYFYLSPLYQLLIKASSRSAQAGFNKEDLEKLYFPLPPLEEQKRIVAKIKELLPLVEQYGKAYENLETFNVRFPEDMKKSILQYAMQGKLVEQKAEESTAEELYRQIQQEKTELIKSGKIKKEKPFVDIVEDEKPFDIPASWKWVRLADVIDVRDGTHDSPKYYDTGIPLITSKNISGGRLSFDNVKYISMEDAEKINDRSMVDVGDILFAMIGSIGNPVIVDVERKFCIKNIALFKNYAKDKISTKYLYWYLFVEQFVMRKIASGGVQAFISLKVFRNYLFPLPPYEEQKRIVAKIDELLPYCERLTK